MQAVLCFGRESLIAPYQGIDPLADTKLGNALTRAIVDTIHEPFLVLDADLRVIVASRSFYHKFQVAQDDDIWRHMPVPTPTTVDDVRAWIQEALDIQARGIFLPFRLE